MTRTLESLKRAPSKEDIFHDHIVSTYFREKPYKKKNKHALKIRHRSKVAAMAGAALAIALLGLAVYMPYQKHSLAVSKEKAAFSSALKIFSDGRINRELIKNLEFRGYAKGVSTFSNKIIVLKNPKKYNWADLSLDFKFPVDLSRGRAVISLRGGIGGEKVSLVVRDANNRSCRLGYIYLDSNWHENSISFGGIKGDIDLSKITHMRLECGDTGESKMDSPINVTVYIKKIEIVKEA